MPELPEVEVVRRGLADHLTGAVFQDVEVRHPRANRGQDAPLPDLLAGARIQDIRRRGKYLWLTLDEESALFVHLGMSGQMLVGDPGTCTSPHLRIRALLIDAAGSPRELAFVDQRTFGRWLHTPTVDGIPAPVTHIALDPLEAGFDPVAVARRIRTKKSPIKSVLLDQTVVSGIGNIYADEALWRSRLHFETPTQQLGPRKAVELIRTAGDVMAEALEQGGTSFDDLYVHVNGESGYFSRSLNAYGQEGRPCPRCGTPIRRVAFQNRSTHFCPACQTI